MVSGIEHTLRIGELARRCEVSPELLRAWERRYGLLSPARTTGGLRLYAARDEERVRAMQRHMAAGHSAAEAARLALAESPSAAPGEALAGGLAQEVQALRLALDGLDADAAQSRIDRELSSFTVESFLSGIVLPYLADLGERWERGEATVAQEHFASNLLRGRLLAMARGWESGAGPVAVLACAPGEQHDLPLIAFGLALRNRGWRIVYLGADTPLEGVAETADRVRPALVVLGTVVGDGLQSGARELRALVARHRVALGGPGVDEAFARGVGAELLEGDPVAAASVAAWSSSTPR